MTIRAAAIGHTGRGDYGHSLDEVWLHVPQAKLVAVADADRMGLAAAAKRLRVDAAYADYREMFDRERPDVVSICPRWIDHHCEMVVEAAARGIHVYLEKPFCRTLAEADRMVDACQRAHVRLALATQTRYSPKLRVVEELIAAGKLGRVLEIRARGKEDARGGAEDLWVLGTHVLDLMRHLGGRARWCQAHLTREGRPAVASDVIDGPEGLGPLAGDHVAAMYALDDSITGYFQSTRGAAGKPSRFGIQILGSAGQLEMLTGYLPSLKFLDDPGWSPGRSGREWRDVSSAGIGKPEPLADDPHSGNLAAVLDLVDAIRQQREPLSGPESARDTLEMIHAVFASHVQQARISLPLAEREHPLAKLK